MGNPNKWGTATSPVRKTKLKSMNGENINLFNNINGILGFHDPTLGH
jgi:hypothetical protein